MTRSRTIENVKEVVAKKYGDQYEVLSTEYVSNDAPLQFMCKDHGEFAIGLNYLINRGQGCKTCMKLRPRKLKHEYEKQLEKLKVIHPDLTFEDFSDTYKGSRTDVQVTCPEHGVFTRSLHHLMLEPARGCPTCMQRVSDANRKYTWEEFLDICAKTHTSKFTYVKESFTGLSGRVGVICPVHGRFDTSAISHARGAGCKKCYSATIGPRSKTSLEDFKEKADAVHPGRFTYLPDDYQGASGSVWVVCSEHGKFLQNVQSHLAGAACPTCGTAQQAASRVTTFAVFFARANELHKNKYTYLEDSYSKLSDNMTAVCPMHGEFSQLAIAHANYGSGCPKCAHTMSGPQIEVTDYVESLLKGEQVLTDYVYNRKVSRREVDIYVPTLKLAIEFNGTWWHSEKYCEPNEHMRKQLELESLGIRLIQVFSDEWLYKEEVVKSLIRDAVGGEIPNLCAAASEVVFIDSSHANLFHGEYNIHGKADQGKSLGLKHFGEVVAVMTMKRSSTCADTGEIVRFSSLTNLAGGAEKLLESHVASENFKTVIGFSDRRLCTGALYQQIGFTEDGDVESDYTYARQNRHDREHKDLFKAENLATKLPKTYNKLLSESENCQLAGYYKVWDCGLVRWKLTLN